MCDYSLQGLPTRLAVAGEHLLTHRFRTGSIGMASPLDLAVQKELTCSHRKGWWEALKLWLNPETELDEVRAICIPPGTRLRMSQVPNQMRASNALREVQEVTFVQVTADAFRYRDAIRFDTGRQDLLQTLPEGVLFQVLWLDLDERGSEAMNLVYSKKAA